VLSIIDKLKKRQEKRTPKTAATRSAITEKGERMKDFIVAMDNYFTLPRVLAKLRELGIGCVGTARYRNAWPPKELRNVDQTSADFNDFFYCVDSLGTLVARWMDDGMVFCVSTVHKVGEVVKRERRRPRTTVKN